MCVLVTCAAPDVPPPQPAIAPSELAIPGDAGVDAAIDAPIDDAPTLSAIAAFDAAPAVIVTAPEVWLKGSTHVHARPSGDSRTPIADVIAWYEQRAYDFIVLTDHNKVSEVDAAAATTVGQVSVRAPATGLIVIAGVELTHNPIGCVPAGDASGQCRIHVNLLGVTGRPTGKIAWAAHGTKERVGKYQAALEQQKLLGGIAQINHPGWFWGMTSEVLVELARRGMPLVEIANVQFGPWNRGDKDHPGLEELWDRALSQGVTLWGVASDDAHDYSGTPGVKYPAGGAWVHVKARREPQAILDALAAGRFYASTGVVLARAEVEGGELVVEVAATEKGSYTIDFIEAGKRVARVRGRTARHVVPATGYVRALVSRGDGAQAWIQPARR